MTGSGGPLERVQRLGHSAQTPQRCGNGPRAPGREGAAAGRVSPT